MRLLFLIGVVVWQVISSNAISPLIIVSVGVNEFSNNLLKTVTKDVSGHLVCSTISANVLLAMATSGARGHTKTALRSALALIGDDSVMLNGYRALGDTLANTTGFELHAANTLYLANGIEPNADFREAIKTSFRSQLENINFGNPSEATKIINDQIAERTNNHIKDLVKESDFTSATVAALVNGVYFKATWEAQFPEQNTKPRPFHVNGQNVKDVATMWNSGIYKHGDLPEIKATFVELPFTIGETDDDVSMIVILPDEINGLGEVIKNLGRFGTQTFLHGTRRHVKVYLPKFKIESTIDLKVPFTKMGLDEIFTGSADFTGIVASPPLKVNNIVQKAVIDINEKGNFVTAVTTMHPVPSKLSWILKNDPIDFNANHPFIALIVTKDGLSLISTVVVEPTY